MTWRSLDPQRVLGIAVVSAFVALTFGCASPPGLPTTPGGCDEDRDCESGQRCLRDGTCAQLSFDAGFDTGTTAPPSADPGGGGVTVPPGLPTSGSGDSTWRPPSAVRVTCPWTSQILSSCPPCLPGNCPAFHCNPTNYVMAVACMGRRELVVRDSPELDAVVRQLTSGTIPDYPGTYPCGGVNTTLRPIETLARRDGYSAEANVGGDLQLIYRELQAGRPVIVVVDTQSSHTTDRMVRSGTPHTMLAVGLDSTHIFFNDPGRTPNQPTNQRIARAFTIDTFLPLWGDGVHLGTYLRFATASSTCTDDCTSGQFVCDGTSASRACMNIDSDPCLELGPRTPCPAGQTCGSRGCSGSACIEGAACDSGNPCEVARVRCSAGRSECVRSGVAPRNTPCVGGVCDGAGQCVCPSGTLWCDGSCVDIGGNPAHCGGCGRRCSTDQRCMGGRCVCVPNCAGRTCGPNGCGGNCGTCAGTTVCTPAGTCTTPTCTPNCAGRTCGLDPSCRVSCGSCPGDRVCNTAGACVCVPNCAGRTCGPNGCGGNCGTCSGSTVCSATGTCVATINPSIGYSPSSGPAGTTFTESGTGFTPGGAVDLRWRYPDGHDEPPGGPQRATASSSGAWSLTWVSPRTSLVGTYRATATDLASGRVATTTFTMSAAPADPRISYSPSSGAAGTTFTESGTGFTPGGAVDLRWRYPDGHDEPPGGPQRATASSSGAWSLTWASPRTSLVGTYRATATDLGSGRMATTTFTMSAAPADPRISYSPSSGAAGTTFTESGTGFTPGGAVDLRWQYPDGHYEPPGGPQRATASSSGAWNIVWTSPSTAMRGTYVATAVDRTSSRSTSTSFTIR